jgi:predicted dehydrogenase
MAEQVKLGIVGLGAQGSMYGQLITDGMVPNMEIGAICETNPGMAKAIRSTYPGVGFYRDLSTMLDSGDVDAVVICVPPYQHPKVAIARWSAISMPSSRSRPAYIPNRCVN